MAGKAARAAGRARHRVRLGEPPLDHFPRGPAQALSGDARRRRRAVAGAAVALGLLGRPALRPGKPRCRLRPRQAVDRAGTPEAARRRAAPRVQGDDPRARCAVACPRHAFARARGIEEAQSSRSLRHRRNALSCASRCVRCGRPHAGGTAAGEIPRPVGRLCRPGVFGVCLLAFRSLRVGHENLQDRGHPRRRHRQGSHRGRDRSARRARGRATAASPSASTISTGARTTTSATA